MCDMRLSAARSIQTTGVLALSAVGDGAWVEPDVLLDVWFVVLKLLQDDDEDVRSGAADCACAALEALAASAVAGKQFCPRRPCILRTLELCFEHLTREFAHAPKYVAYLFQTLYPSAAAAPGSSADAALSFGAAAADGRPIFEVEDNNMHREACLASQMAARNLLALVSSTPPPTTNVLRECLATTAERVLIHLQAAFALALTDASERFIVGGNLSFEAVAFRELYSTALAALVVVSAEGGDYDKVALRTALSELQGLPAFVRLHPLIRMVLEVARDGGAAHSSPLCFLMPRS